MKHLFLLKIQLLERIWYTEKHPIAMFLLPFSWAYKSIASLRRCYLRQFRQTCFPVPIVIVGNITVGGAGKTPLVIALASHFQKNGMYVGIVSRGYGAQCKQFPHEVSLEHDTARDVGDEPLLIARRTQCPVIIGPKRVHAVKYLLKRYPACQVILSDDGLQHYALGRQLEIAVVDGRRGLGNEKCLPAGPLREGRQRLYACDLMVVNDGTWNNAFQMDLKPAEVMHMKSGAKIPLSQLPMPIAAVAGIGNPDRFFTTLRQLGLPIHPYPFPDHHDFQKSELNFKEATVIMTEKDAVKCQPFAEETWYYLPVTATLDDSFWNALDSHLGTRLVEGFA